jgi:choice-of-anchor B domain-containing protein
MRTARWFAAAALCAAVSASAHDDLLGTRYVAATGVDEGRCDHAHAPCRTIQYALDNGLPGGTVKVAEGLFSLEGLQVEEILHGKTGVTGGFRVADGFRQQDLATSGTQVHGASLFFREKLAARGLNLIVDAVAVQLALQAAQTGSGPTYRTMSLRSQVAVECTQGMAGQFPCREVDFLGRVARNQFSSSPGSLSNLWGFVDLDDNREYAVVGLRDGTAVVDLTDPQDPREVGTVPGLDNAWREVKVYQYFDAAANRHRAYAYVTTEASQGLQVIDLSNLPASVSLANTIRTFDSAHTLYVSNVDYATNMALAGREAFLYVAGSNRNTGNNGGSFLIFDLDDPAAPRLVTTAPPGTGYMHDSTSLLITDNRTAQCGQGHNPCEVLVDFNEDTVDLWDVTDKAQPERLSSTGYATSRYTHSGWPSEDQRTIIVHDELDELRIGNFRTQIYALDVDDLRAPVMRTAAQGSTTSTDHNGYMVRNRYYVAHYRRGVVVFDATDPHNLVETSFLDTFLSPADNVASTSGAWGVYPFLPSGSIVVSDIENGLFIVRDVQPSATSPGRIGFTTLAHTSSEGGGTILVPIRRTRGLQGPVTVNYATRDGTATAGSDYTAASGMLTFPAGVTTELAVSIPLSGDGQSEPDETLTLVLSSPTGGATIDGSSELTITIRNDDSAGGGGGGGGGALTWPALSLLTLLLLPGAVRAWTRIRGRGSNPSA